MKLFYCRQVNILTSKLSFIVLISKTGEVGQKVASFVLAFIFEKSILLYDV